MDLGLQDTVALVVDSHLGIATAAAASLANEGAILSLTAPDNYHMRHVEIELARSNIPQDRFRARHRRPQPDSRHPPPGARDPAPPERYRRAGQHGAGAGPSSAMELEEENIEPAMARNFFSAVQLTREVLPPHEAIGHGPNHQPHPVFGHRGLVRRHPVVPEPRAPAGLFQGPGVRTRAQSHHGQQHHLLWC